MKTYVISLYRDTLDYFKRVNSSVENIETYLASRPKMIFDYDKERFNNLNLRSISLGEFGCLRSHVAVLNEFLRSSDDWLCVLEDDALLCENLNDFLEELSRIQCDLGSIYLLGHSKTSKEWLKVQRLIQPLIDLHSIGEYQFGRNSIINRCGTVAYCMNRVAAKKYLEWTIIENYWLADDWSRFYLFSRCNIYHPITPLVYEDLSVLSSTENAVIDKYKISAENFLIIFGAIVKNQVKRLLGLIH